MMTIERKQEIAREIFARMLVEQMEPLRHKSEFHDVIVDQFEEDLMLREGLPNRIVKPEWPYDLVDTLIEEYEDTEEGYWHKTKNPRRHSKHIATLKRSQLNVALEVYAVYQAAAREIRAACEAEDLI